MQFMQQFERVTFNRIRFCRILLKICIPLLPFRNEDHGCLGRRQRALMKPLRISPNIHMFQYADIVNAPAKVQAVAAQLCHRAEFFVITSQA